MPALPFEEQFAPAVESGETTQTIRRVRKRPIKVGNTLYLKTGMRTKHCRSLGTTICTKVTPVKIYPIMVALGDRALLDAQADRFARKDGFADMQAMADWFERQYGGLPFRGVVIAWPCPDWPRANRRRGELIEKEIAGRLLAAECSELERLQRLADIIVDAVGSLPLERLEGLLEDLRIRELQQERRKPRCSTA